MTSVTAEHLHRAVSPVQQLRNENAQLREQLERSQALASVGTMTAMILHEFNNILTPIINYAALAADGDEQMVAKAIRKTSEGGRRAVDICDALLSMLRNRTREPVRVRLAELVEQSLLAMGRNPAKDGITVHIAVPGGLSAMARPAELMQVLVNLLINARAAIAATDARGRITITASRADETVTLSVADNGTGIAPEHISRLFEPFFTTKHGGDAADGGTGLGLAVCKQLLHKMHGDIAVESTLGQGTTFHITLPA